MLGILDPNDPGLYAVQRGRLATDVLMVPDVGTGGRYHSTSGNAVSANGETGWMHSVGLGVFLLGTALLLIHARAAVAVRAAVGG